MKAPRLSLKSLRYMIMSTVRLIDVQTVYDIAGGRVLSPSLDDPEWN